MATVLDPGQALDLVAAGLDRPVLAVSADGGDALGRLALVAPHLPCVTVLVGEPGTDAGAFDVAVTDEADLDLVVEQAERCPGASVALVQLLRLGESLDLRAALVAESLVYGLLQSGPEFAAWLAARGDRAPTTDDGPTVRVERDGDILTVTLDRPHVRNAFSALMRDELVEALEIATIDAAVERVELRGAGPSFCSGGDLSEFGTAPDPVTAHLVRSTRNAGAALAACADRVTAHVHGACVGAGTELAAFASRVVAAPDATFRLPEVSMGLVPGAGGTASLPRRIGRHRTAWLALTGATLDATTALAWGLVDTIS